MSVATAKQTLTVALIGNPNTGKSTLFNALCGVRQRVGNYPGVTVEKKLGRLRIDGRELTIIDLPGTYSLAPRSPDEMIAVDVLLGRRIDTQPPDVVLCIVDASNLERNLYLVSQVLELGRPVVLALNMVDLAAQKGHAIDVERLRQKLPVPMVALQAHRKIGLSQLKAAILQAAADPPPHIASPLPEAMQHELQSLAQSAGEELPRYLLERLVLDTSGYLERTQLRGAATKLMPQIRAIRERLGAPESSVAAIEPMARYRWIATLLEGVVERSGKKEKNWSDRLDRLLTSRFWGTLVFAAMMLVLFQAVFYVAEPASAIIDALKSWAAGAVEAQLAPGALRSLVISGMIEGVGSVLVFLPQIFVLFLFIAILEDCGYMARAAYLMDRLMSRVGLSGKSFIPLLSSFACAIPGIMSARVIENSRDRLVTILVAPLMSCSARLPVYVLLTAAFIPDTSYLGGVIGLRGLTMFSMYLIGILAAVAVTFTLKKTILRGPTPPFVLELPSYKLPAIGVVLHRMFERGWAFVRRAGTLIFAVAILIWAAAYYPRDNDAVDDSLWQRQAQLASAAATLQSAPGSRDELEQVEQELARVDEQIEGAYLRNSYLGRVGRTIEPLVLPLGWDWRIGCAVIASFPAREVVIATMGVIYNLGSDEDEESQSLQQTLQQATWDETGLPVFSIPVALSLMVFFALCAQCVSTLAVMKRETNSWRWPAFTFVYMTGLAYLAALLTYQIGIRI